MRWRHVSLRLIDETDAEHIVAWLIQNETASGLHRWSPLNVQGHQSGSGGRRSAALS